MSEHRVVERLDRRTIGKQITLPFTKALEISIKSLNTRFRRSLITVGLIMLAIAFLMTILTTNAFENALVQRAKAPVPAGLSDEDLAAWRAETNALRISLGKRMPGSLEGPETGEAGVSISPQQWWLIILSLTVAVVGIVNAMLMSVTERYREIGTMKCLGALDSFIIRLFLLESVFQGTAGTIIGTVVGFLLIFLHTLLLYGTATVKTFPLRVILQYGIMSIVIGFLLSVFGAILPAYRAARMQPVEAMRVDE